jgi:histidyl-tRNA synthetase
LNQIRRIKGTQDILPGQSKRWIALETTVRTVMETYNYEQLRTPVFEFTELFARGIGQLTDIVSKEMYTFLDRGKKQLTLKPEMTAPIIRAYLENKLYAQSPLNKLYYIAPLFRQENPQAGRLRQFHQFGAESLGSADPAADTEIIALSMAIIQELGLPNVTLFLNSVGDPECRSAYKITLQDYIRPRLPEYCEDCQRRFEENPMRILDCKKENCAALNQEAPKIVDHLCEHCDIHFTSVKEQLNQLQIPFELEPFLVRGLDYYTRTVFEIVSDNLGSQNAICGGGRYDLLAEELGGASTPAVGFAAGIERILMVLEAAGVPDVKGKRLDIFLVALGEEARKQSIYWIQTFRNAGLRSEQDFLNRSVKAQFREANRQNTRFVLVLGEEELSKKLFSVKFMDDSEQVNVPFEQITDFLKKKMEVKPE